MMYERICVVATVYRRMRIGAYVYMCDDALRKNIKRSDQKGCACVWRDANCVCVWRIGEDDDR